MEFKSLDADKQAQYIEKMKNDLAGSDVACGKLISFLLHKTNLQFQELISIPPLRQVQTNLNIF